MNCLYQHINLQLSTRSYIQRTSAPIVLKKLQTWWWRDYSKSRLLCWSDGWASGLLSIVPYFIKVPLNPQTISELHHQAWIIMRKALFHRYKSNWRALLSYLLPRISQEGQGWLHTRNIIRVVTHNSPYSHFPAILLHSPPYRFWVFSKLAINASTSPSQDISLGPFPNMASLCTITPPTT